MISYLAGKIIYKSEPTKKGAFVILNVSGVGYEVSITLKTYEKVKVGENIELYTFLYVREDAMELFGFPTPSEAEFFKLLNNISGIGPKSALNILELADVKSIQDAVIAQKAEMLEKINGISRTTAEKIILGLKSHIKKFAYDGMEKRNEENLEIVDALISLGFPIDRIRKALLELPADKKDNKEKIKAALKILGKKK